jgi:tetratricopeptide (TPR) repeat protein
MLKDLGRTADAEDAFTQACDLFAALDAARQLAWTRRDLGCLYRDSGRADLAERLFRDSEQVFRQLGDRRQLAVSLKDRGVLRLEEAIVSASERAGLGEQADALFREALELSETLKERDLTAWVLRYRGLTDGLLGRLEAARALIALSRERFDHFKESNQALCDYLADHIGQVRHPHLLELFGRLVPQTPLTYSRLLK